MLRVGDRRGAVGDEAPEVFIIEVAKEPWREKQEGGSREWHGGDR